MDFPGTQIFNPISATGSFSGIQKSLHKLWKLSPTQEPHEENLHTHRNLLRNSGTLGMFPVEEPESIFIPRP